uniref:Uncharacterized protein n=1 Tax=Sphaerodactylus townsendi TaxID=933632 RepID=A0ACB8F2Z2_9SAUR
MNISESSLEILESGMYFTYVYVAYNESSFSEHYLFTVQLATDSNVDLSVLKGPNEQRASVNLGRPYFLQKGTRLHLKINDGLKHIDINRTYWGLFKITSSHAGRTLSPKAHGSCNTAIYSRPFGKRTHSAQDQHKFIRHSLENTDSSDLN